MKMTLGKRSRIADLGLYEAKSLSSVKLTGFSESQAMTYRKVIVLDNLRRIDYRKGEKGRNHKSFPCS